MRKLLLLTVFSISVWFNLNSQTKMIVFLKNKTGSTLNDTSFYSNKSIQRRSKNHVKWDELDIPVNTSYLEQLSSKGTILNVSRWLNAISFSSDLDAIRLKTLFPFIESIQTIHAKPNTVKKDMTFPNEKIDYGFAQNQINQIELNCLHEQDYNGKGISIGVLDAGFSGMNTMSAFDSLTINHNLIETFDFVNNTDFVYAHSEHGTYVSSCIVANLNGQETYVGTAKDVQIALYITEDANSETELEEFNLVVGLERCDQQGIDIASISLGYFQFDDPSTNHSYNELDGKTTIAAKGVNIAHNKGILVVSAAGNSGPSTISTPCDAVGGLCVGAIDVLSNYADFSSIGPAADNRVKPDIVARGENSIVVSPQNTIEAANGTSFATPIMSGALACLMQANPYATVDEIINAIRESASQFQSPNQFIGYGIANLCKADSILENNHVNSILSNNLFFYPNPSKGVIQIVGQEQSTLRIFDNLGKLIYETTIFSNYETIDITHLETALYRIQITNGNDTLNQSLIISN